MEHEISHGHLAELVDSIGYRPKQRSYVVLAVPAGVGLRKMEHLMPDCHFEPIVFSL
ncbi:hypothetical protein GV791_07985 [Nocardia cyriacigeorgica]|uniref:Uncharacterized protein n=1 Tax=Nocardia cyriacigeorgica TaxID=135487 RepID=A0A6P1CJ96_9NOCA|nr:hypothetical protein [Nocardia cyriacigeorgica]NEW32498.1 hypothetical protein [Nocardia cyriacigeorgica]